MKLHKFKHDLGIPLTQCAQQAMTVRITEHFLLLCPSFDSQRRDLFTGIVELVRPVIEIVVFSNLVPRVSSLLYLYSGMQEAVQQSDWLFAILHGNSVLCGINNRGMSKFDIKPYSLPILTIICNLFPEFHFGSCGESFSNFQLRPVFIPNKPCLFHIKLTCYPQIIVRIPLRRLK